MLALVRHSWIWPLWMQFRLLSKQEAIAERRELFESFNGNEFFPLKPWPQEYQSMFWAKPIDDKTTFKLMLFCFRNACAPQLIAAAASEPEANERGSERARQFSEDYFIGACNFFFLPNARNCGYAQMGDLGCAVVCARNCGYARTETF